MPCRNCLARRDLLPFKPFFVGQQVFHPFTRNNRPPVYSLWRRYRLYAPISASRGGSSPGSDPSPNSAEEAFAVAEECMRLFETSDTASILQYLPDSVIDNALERKRSKLSDAWGNASTPGANIPASGLDGDLRLDELLELVPATAFFANSFAMRAVIFTPPAAAQPLSTLRIAPGRCWQRYQVTAASGERLHLTFDMQLEDALEPRYRGLRVIKRWYLRGITGEPEEPDPPLAPSPSYGPEAIVAAQLNGLRAEDEHSVFQFASPRNREAFEGSMDRFVKVLNNDVYSPLLRHTKAELLRSTQMTADRSFIVVGVTAAGVNSSVPRQYLYGWAVGLQGADAGSFANCWMTEAVYPLSGSGLFDI